MINPTIPTLTSPQGIDIAFEELQTALMAGLSWLTIAYGKAQKYVRDDGAGRPVYYPAVYAGKKDYLGVFPDEHLGNYSFFDVQDGETVEYYKGGRAKVGLVFFFDFAEVYPLDWESRSIENVKNDVYTVIDDASLKYSRHQILAYYEQTENIFKGYTHREIDNLFRMRPFGMFRVEMDFNFYIKPLC